MDVQSMEVETSKPPVEASVQSAFEATIAEMRKELDALKAEKSKSALAEDERAFNEEAQTALESPCSAVFGVLLDPSSTIVMRCSVVVLITLLTFTQLFLCYAFWDTSGTLHFLGQHPQYAPPVPMGNYYKMRTGKAHPPSLTPPPLSPCSFLRSPSQHHPPHVSHGRASIRVCLLSGEGAK